jgi:AbrB family looped-hinge helix DNA binding protein
VKNSNNLKELEEPPKDPSNFYRRIQGLLGEQSFSIILPKRYAIDLGLSKGDYVKVRQEENKIVIEKA